MEELRVDDIRKDEPKRTLGQIKVLPDESPPQLAIAGRPAPTSTIYEWTPAQELMEQLPEGFTFRLRCITGSDGIRRFYPVDDFETFIAVGFMVGLAVLSAIKNLEPEQCKVTGRCSCYSSGWPHQGAFAECHFGFHQPTALASRPRPGRRAQHLPETVGLNTQGLAAQGLDEPWSVDRLMSEGRQAAREAGIEKPTEADRVQYGLLAAATLNPLSLPIEKVPMLVQQALYDEIPADKPIDANIVQAVIERTLAAVHRHLDESADEFNKWFMGKTSSFVGQISRRKLLPGGRMDQTVVRRALLDLGIQAYPYVAGAIHAAMRLFQNAIPDPMSDAERTCFEQMHLPQPHFGNLPLVLLVERFPLIKETVWSLFQNPGDENTVGILHRLLDWYADLARSRRKADRKIKDRRPANLVEGDKSPLTVPFSEELVAREEDEVQEPSDDAPTENDGTGETGVTASGGVSSLFEDIAERLCASRQVRCNCGLQNWHHEVDTLVLPSRAYCGLEKRGHGLHS